MPLDESELNEDNFRKSLAVRVVPVITEAADRVEVTYVMGCHRVVNDKQKEDFKKQFKNGDVLEMATAQSIQDIRMFVFRLRTWVDLQLKVDALKKSLEKREMYAQTDKELWDQVKEIEMAIGQQVRQASGMTGDKLA